jgi:hypothetical protein
MSDRIEISGLGKLSVASEPDLPLLIVFGGVDVHQSDIDGIKRDKKHNPPVSADGYMWNYMKDITDKYHIFVSIKPDHLDGVDAYDKLMTEINHQKLAPSKQILYLFSGGWRPGMWVLKVEEAVTFSWILLVDIWMGIGKDKNTVSPDFYKPFVIKNRDKTTYIYTDSGPANEDAKKSVVRTLGSDRAIFVPAQKTDIGKENHMRTNAVAVGLLK